MLSKILEVLAQLFSVIKEWWARNPRVDVDPKIKEALKIREEINEITNYTILKMQQRKLDELQSSLDTLQSKLESLNDIVRKTNPPTR